MDLQLLKKPHNLLYIIIISSYSALICFSVNISMVFTKFDNLIYFF